MGFISTKAHTVIGIIVGVVLLLAPTIFNFSDNTAATMSAVIVGVFILLNELITTSPYSPIKLVPMKVHVVLDVLTGVFLALTPFLFNFANGDDKAMWVPHIVVGIMVAGYALLTTTADDRAKSVLEK